MREVRVCVKSTETGFKIDRVGATVPNAAEVLDRVLLYIRATSGVVEQEHDGCSVTEFAYVGIEEDERKVCIVADLDRERIQFSIVGVSKWEASELVSVASAYLKGILVGSVVE